MTRRKQLASHERDETLIRTISAGNLSRGLKFSIHPYMTRDTREIVDTQPLIDFRWKTSTERVDIFEVECQFILQSIMSIYIIIF